MSKNPKDVKISKAKGRPMLMWVGKTPLNRVKTRTMSPQRPQDWWSDT